jgi:NADH-quinone oxidoreductase subunit G
MRILPRLHEEVNEEWISDKTRFSYDGLKRRRLDVPMLKRGGKLSPCEWRDAFAAIKERMGTVDPRKVAFVVGDLVDCETMVMVKDLAAALGTPHVDCRQDGAKLQPGVRASYLFNSTIAGIEKADACLLIGANPRWEAPIVNLRLRKRWRQGGFKAGRVGTPFDLTYPVEELGAGGQTMHDLLGDGHSFASALEAAKHPMLILGIGALARPDGAAVLGLARQIAERFGMVGDGWNGFNVLHTAASRVGGMDLGLVPGEGGRDVADILAGVENGEIEVVFLLGADEIEPHHFANAFVVYQGHHGDRGAHAADVILPGCAYTEKNATYVNLEGRAQRARLAVFPPGEAKEDWKILRALSEVLGCTIGLNSLSEVRARMAEIAPHLAHADIVTPAEWAAFGAPGEIANAPFASPIGDFYLTDPISRASSVMNECSGLFVGGLVEGATGTHG